MFCATPIKNRYGSFTKILTGFWWRDEASFVKINHCLPILFFFHFFTIWLILGQGFSCLLTKCKSFNQGEIKIVLSGSLWLGLA
jgi:hypothetical protein